MGDFWLQIFKIHDCKLPMSETGFRALVTVGSVFLLFPLLYQKKLDSIKVVSLLGFLPFVYILLVLFIQMPSYLSEY